MKIAQRTNLTQRIASIGFAFVLALSTVTASASLLFSKQADALPVGQTQLRLTTAAPAAIALGNTTSFSVKDVTGLGGDGWTNTLTGLLLNATIKATVTNGKIATNCSAPANQWGPSATVTIGAGYKVVEGTFCYKGTVAGTENIQLAAHVNRIGSDINDSTVVPVTVNPVGVPANLRLNGDKACGYITNVNWITPTWNAVTGAVSYNYKVTLPNGSTYGPVNVGNVTSVSGVFGGEGSSTFSVQAVNANGYVSEWVAPCAVTYDATPPVAPTLLTPAKDSFINVNTFWFDWETVSDAARYEVQYSQSGTVNGDGGFTNVDWTGDANHVQPTDSRAWSEGAQGKWYWQVRAIDAAGNKSPWSQVWSVTIDTVFPTLAFTGTTPADGAYVKGIVPVQTVINDANIGPFNLRIEDGAPAPLSLGLYYINAPVSGATNTYNWDTKSGINSVSDGAHKLLATTTDKAGNKTTITRTVIVDNTRPEVTITAPNASSYNPTTMSVNATDNLALDIVTANIYNETNTGSVIKSCSKSVALATTYVLNCPISGLADGVYTIRTNARDKAGTISNTLTRQFTIDTTDPEVTLSSYNAAGNVITPVITATDNSTPLTYAWSGSNPNVTLSATNVLMPQFTVAADGTYSFNLEVTDAAGNSTTKTFTFTYTQPALTVARGVSNLTIGGQNAFTNVVFAGATTDDNTDDTTPVDTDADVRGVADEKDTKVLGTTTTPELKGDDTKVLGLTWYWWIPIVAGVGGAAWWLLAAFRRRNGGEA